MSVCIHVYVSEHMNIIEHIYLYVFICVYIYIYIYTYTYVCVYICIQIYIYIYICVYTYICIQVRQLDLKEGTPTCSGALTAGAGQLIVLAG